MAGWAAVGFIAGTGSDDGVRVLPSQAGHAGDVLGTDGSSASWVAHGSGGGSYTAGANVSITGSVISVPSFPAGSVTGLASVAKSGAYSDLTGVPLLGSAAGQASSAFATAAQGAKADSAVQPGALKPVATTGVYADLTGKPALFSGAYSDLTGRPTLGTAAATDATAYATAAQGGKADTAVQPAALKPVATTGAYADLTGKPALFSGSYTDLSNKPTIPAAQVNADWNAASGAAQILNKPTLFSGAYTDLTGRPALSTVATSGSYTDLANKPTIPAAQVNSDWNAASGSAQILNKPTIPPALPTQTGNAGKVLSTDGTSASWVTPAAGGAALPDQTGQSGKVLGTNGTAAAWVAAPAPSFIAANGAVTATASGSFAIAIGQATAQTPAAVAVGYSALAGDGGGALGGQTAIGTSSKTGQQGATALGSQSWATHQHSTALGSTNNTSVVPRTITTRDKQIMLGSAAHEVAIPSGRLVMKSPNGTEWTVKVADDGTLSATQLT